MSATTANNSEFLLLFRNTQLETRLTLEEMQEAMQRLNQWLERGNAQGLLKGGQPLGYEGRVISGAKNRVVTDGPFAEAKEAVGGYVIVQARDLEEAGQFAEEWPLLDYGAFVEVRPLLTQCAAMTLTKMEMAPVGV
jgi:hypothetical protein